MEKQHFEPVGFGGADKKAQIFKKNDEIKKIIVFNNIPLYIDYTNELYKEKNKRIYKS